jgi:hypothetical protein
MEQCALERIAMARNDEEYFMEKKSSSLSELREAGAARKIMRAQDATVQALDEIKRTTQVLQSRVNEARSQGLASRRDFSVARAAPRLPRAAPFWG